MKMKLKKGQSVQPRTGETHGLFGVRFVKHHNMRDVDWTAKELVTQYEKISNIYRKANNIFDMQQEQKEVKSIERYKQLKKEVKDKRELLKIALKGDIQRTKNVLQDHPKYQKMYQNKQSYEVLQELDHKCCLERKKYDRCKFEKDQLMKRYEEKLIEVAIKQETIRYYDVTEFKEELETKKLLVDLKNSETRIRAIRKINSTYKKVINQLLHDSLYYQPVLDALQADYKEQTTLVEQTYNIGNPAIKSTKDLERSLKRLEKRTRKDEMERTEVIDRNKGILKEHPKIVKELVRRDSDFSILADRYDRDTRSMTTLKTDIESVDKTIKMLKATTLSSHAEDIYNRVESQTKYNEKMKHQMQKREKLRDSINDREEFARFVHELLLDDVPQIYNDEKLIEIEKLKNSIKVEKNKQQTDTDHMMKRGHMMCLMRYALQHMLDVLRHVGTPDVYRKQEFPTINLRLPLLKFNLDMPPPPQVIEIEPTKLLALVKARVQTIMQYYQKDKNIEELSDATSKYQQTIIEEMGNLYRHRPLDFDYD
ncbi:unnamed protein product [Diamesa tonsa]